MTSEVRKAPGDMSCLSSLAMAALIWLAATGCSKFKNRPGTREMKSNPKSTRPLEWGLHQLSALPDFPTVCESQMSS